MYKNIRYTTKERVGCSKQSFFIKILYKVAIAIDIQNPSCIKTISKENKNYKKLWFNFNG